jgi:uncharacterized phage protein gp47/JayE
MISSPIFVVSASGITAPTYDEILEYFKDRARTIFGSDINLDADTQDGQLLAIFAAAINDLNAQAIAVFNSYNPHTASGVALDGAVKTNGLTRLDASKSLVDLKLVGTAGTVITNGVAIDTSDNRWLLPAQVSIPLSGEVVVTAEAQKVGAVSAGAGSITKIGTPTLGWHSVTNPVSAQVGEDVETDAALRVRQALSTMQPTVGLWEGLIGSLAQLDDVHSVAGRHNDTGTTSSDGIPAHSIAIVVAGGNVNDIAETIFKKKSQGVATFGSTSVQYTDSFGNANAIKFSRPSDVKVSVELSVKPTASWLSTVEGEIKERVASYINGLEIGEVVSPARVATIAVRRKDCSFDDAFTLEKLLLNSAASSVKIAWNQKAVCSASDVKVTVG